MREWVACLLLLCAACEREPTPGAGAPSKPAVVEQAPASAAPAPAAEALDAPIPVVAPDDDTPKLGGKSGDHQVDAPLSETFGPGRDLQDCLSNCATKISSEDNRATCRLLCESHHTRAASGQDSAHVDGFVTCFDACEGESSCRKRCAAQPGAGSCTQACLERFGNCLAPCVGAADEGRCSERCETTARGCVNGC